MLTQFKKHWLKPLKHRASQGDTIVEVMMSMAILALVIGVSYASSTHTLQTSTDSSIRSQALAYNQEQLELIKTAANSNSSLITQYETPASDGTDNFCVDPANGNKTVINASNPTCTEPVGGTASPTGVTVTDTYNSTTKTFVITTQWPSTNPSAPHTVTVYYKPQGNFVNTPGSYTPTLGGSSPTVQTTPPTITTVGTTETAIANGLVNPNGLTTTCAFWIASYDYSTRLYSTGGGTYYGCNGLSSPSNAGTSNVPVYSNRGMTIKSGSSHEAYYVQFCGTNPAGQTCSAIQTIDDSSATPPAPLCSNFAYNCTPSTPPATATIGAANESTTGASTTFSFAGTIMPNNWRIIRCYFLWSAIDTAISGTTGGNTATCANPPSEAAPYTGSTSIPVSGSTTTASSKFSPSTRQYYKLCINYDDSPTDPITATCSSLACFVSSTDGSDNISDCTAGNPPTFQGLAVGKDNANPTTKVMLGGQVNPNNYTLTNCYFEYGTTTVYGNQAQCIPISSVVPNSIGYISVEGLVASTVFPGPATYHFHLCAQNTLGYQCSGDQCFQVDGSGNIAACNGSLQPFVVWPATINSISQGVNNGSVPWDSTNISSCNITTNSPGLTATGTFGSVPIPSYPGDSSYTFKLTASCSSANGGASASYAYNFKCGNFVTDFSITCAGASGVGSGTSNCYNINSQPADPDSWANYYFCQKNGSLKNLHPTVIATWSNTGPIAGQFCTAITEPADPNWNTGNNYMCSNNGAVLQFAWSSAGKPTGYSFCLAWNNPVDNHGWWDDYLCGTEVL